MKTLLMVASLATVVFLPLGSAQAQYQGSNQAADDATNWAAAGGHYGSAYARSGHRRYHRQ